MSRTELCRRAAGVALAAGVCGWGVGCSLPEREVSLESRDPSGRSEALARLLRDVGSGAVLADEVDARALVPLLASTDPAVRLLAQRALEALRGETLGYDYAGPERERSAAIDRWVRALDDRSAEDGV